MSQASDIERAPESSEEETNELAAPQPEIEEDEAPARARKRRKVEVKPEPSPVKTKVKSESDSDIPFPSSSQSRKKSALYGRLKASKKIQSKYDERIQKEKRAEESGFRQPPQFTGTKVKEFVRPGTLNKRVASKPRGRKTTRRLRKEGSPQPANLPQPTFNVPATSMLKKTLGLSERNTPDASRAHRSRRAESVKEESSSELSSATESEPDDFSTSYDKDLGGPSAEMTEVPKRCPVCDKKLLRSTWSLFLVTLPELQRDGRFLTRHQVQFHNFHQKHTAKKEWRKRDYPAIDWTRLPARINALRGDIESVIDGTEPSIYADGLRDLDKGRSSRRQKVASEFAGDFGSNSVGYYGGRGAQAIGVEVADMFTSKFLEDAQHDIISAAGGNAMYIQKVIVPEVASRLIAQDMQCELADARNILKESADLGQALCEEENDDVHEDEDEDAGQSD